MMKRSQTKAVPRPPRPQNLGLSPEPATGRTPFLMDAAALLGIVLLAFAVRVVHLYQARSLPFFYSLISDARVYDAWAQRIAAGDWLGKEVFYQAPLYPYLLALLQLMFGHDLWWVRIVQIGLGAVSCGLLYLAGRSYFSRAVGIAAGLILALYPPAIFFEGLIQKAVLDGLWTALLLWLLSRARQHMSAIQMAAVGLVVALFCLTRENALLLIPLLAGWLLLRARGRGWVRGMLPLAGFAVGLAVVLLPIGFRNLAVGGEFVLTTAQAGPNFYIGNNPSSLGGYVPLRPGRGDAVFERRDATELAEQAAGRRLTPGQVSGYWFGRAWDFMRKQPDAWLALLGKKIVLTVNAYEIPDAEDLYFYERNCTLLRVLGTVGHLGVVFPLAAAGMALTWVRRRELGLLYALLVTLVASVAAFYVFARYRYPIVPILALFAGAALVEGYRQIRNRRPSALAIPVLALLIAAVLANWRFFDKDMQLGVSYANSAAALLGTGRFAEAIDHAQTAIRLDPRVLEAYQNLAESLKRTGRLEEAAGVLQAGLTHGPRSVGLHTDLAGLLMELGDLAGARQHVDAALRAAPEDADALSQLGLMLLESGQPARAMELLEASQRRTSESVKLALRLAWGLAVCPDASLRDGPRAVQIVEDYCKNRPGLCIEDRALDIVAAAYAEAGRMVEAVAAAHRALELAQAQPGQTRLIAAIQQRLALYEAGKAFHIAE